MEFLKRKPIVSHCILEIGPVFVTYISACFSAFWLVGKYPQTHELEYNDALIAMQKRNMQLSTLCLGAEKAFWKDAPHGNGEVTATDPAGDVFFGESQTNSWKHLLQRLVTVHSGAVCTSEEDISC